MTTTQTIEAPARVPTWERAGTAVTAKTAAEAIKQAGLDWTVGKYPVYAQIEQSKIRIPDRFAILREDTRALMGVVSGGYEPFQNHEAFEFFDNLVDSGEAEYTTAGPLRGGRVVWLSAKVPDGILIGGEQVNLYLLLATSHDGSKAVQVAVTPVRVVCENTLILAIRKATRKWSVRHLSTMQGRIQEARSALELTFAYADEFKELGDALLGKAMSERKVNAFIDELAGRSERTAQALKEAWATSTTLGEVRNTAWGALNAVAEYFEWTVPRTDDSRLRSTLEGRAFAMRDRALALLEAV